jgi:type IV pilus assembly protein PilW
MPVRDIRVSRKYASGLSLIELMIAIALGLFITGIVSFVFLDSSRSFRELRKSGEQIESGRFALSLLADDIRHAGYFGQLGKFNAFTVVDPCVAPTLDHLASPVQVYSPTSLSTQAALPSCLPATEVAVGSDVVVVRRADTNPLVSDTITSAKAVSNVVYLQANATEAEIQLGSGGTIDQTKKASGAVASILRKDGKAAPIRRLHVHMYYVSPCSQVSCASGSDGIPTLKRMELATGGGTPTWIVVPLVSGIEYLQVDLGLDTLPSSTNLATASIGDGAADGAFIQTTTAWNDVVSSRINLLSRTLEPTPGYSDSSRKYQLGLAGYPTVSGAFKRKVFAEEVRLNNPSSRRERVAGEY